MAEYELMMDQQKVAKAIVDLAREQAPGLFTAENSRFKIVVSKAGAFTVKSDNSGAGFAVTVEVENKPNLSEQVMLMSIEQSKAIYENRMEDSKRLADQMIEIVKQGVNSLT